MLRKLTEQQLDRIINEKNFSLIFTLNGLPNPSKEKIPRKMIADFLNKHSSAWRRQQSIAKKRKEMKNKKKEKKIK